MNYFKSTLSLLLISSLFTSSYATVIYQDDFESYPDGSSLSSSDTWGTHSGTAGQITVQNGEITLKDSDSEDIGVEFAPVSSGELFFSADVTISDPGSYGSDHEYWMHFMSSATGGFNSRTDFQLKDTGFTAGISGSSSSAQSIWGTDLAYDTTYKVVVGYDFSDGISTLWIDPTSSNDINIAGNSAAATSIQKFAFRQSGASGTQVITVDNLIIADDFNSAAAVAVPEPSSYALLVGIFGMTWLLCRRR